MYRLGNGSELKARFPSGWAVGLTGVLHNLEESNRNSRGKMHNHEGSSRNSHRKHSPRGTLRFLGCPGEGAQIRFSWQVSVCVY